MGVWPPATFIDSTVTSSLAGRKGAFVLTFFKKENTGICAVLCLHTHIILPFNDGQCRKTELLVSKDLHACMV